MPLIYLDANLLVAQCVDEAHSQTVQDWLEKHSESLFATSAWAIAEVTSAIGLKVRRKDLSHAAAAASLDLFHEQILPHLQVIEIIGLTFARAESLLRIYGLGLRTPDALHLAICLEEETRILATADRALYAAARKLKQAAMRVY